MIRVLLVGAVVRDTVLLPAGSRRQGLGGLTFAVEAMAALGAGETEILPLCPVGADLAPTLRRRWRALPGVRIDHLRVHEAPNPTVTLDYREPGLAPGERTERLTGPLPPLEAADLEGLPAVDAVLVNCIAGDDLTAAALELLARDAPILHLDLHSRLLARSPDGRRRPRRPADWRRWLRAADLVQCNLSEAATLTGVADDGGTDPSAGAPAPVAAGTSLVSSRRRPRRMVVTAGAAGAWLLGEGPPARIPAPEVEVVDPTGAGDVLGAALVLGRARGLSVHAATRWAVAVATASCALRGAEESRRLATLAPPLPETSTGPDP